MRALLAATIFMASSAFCFSQSEQEILDKGGSEAARVIDKAYEQLAGTELFEFPDLGWGTPSASCWALTVLTRYDQEQAAERFKHILNNTENTALRLYAIIGLQLLEPNEELWKKELQDKEFLAKTTYYSSGCLSAPVTVAELVEMINNEGGLKALLFQPTLPRLYRTLHSYAPPTK